MTVICLGKDIFSCISCDDNVLIATDSQPH